MLPKKSYTYVPTQIEKILKKKTPIELILERPNQYIGSIIKQEEKLWVYDEFRDKFINKKISYAPGLYKIFDEILVNASDNFHRMIFKLKL